MRTEDGCIIQECLNGRPEAFGVLVDKYKEGIYAFVYAELRNFHDAQDVVQEVFVEAYRGLRSLRRWESFGFWIYRIARRRCLMWFRTRSKRVDREFIEDQDPKVINAPALDSHHVDRLSESVREALDSLPETYREALMLYYFGGMNSVDIAKALGTSPTAIRHRLSRARARLREEMITMMDTALEGQKLPSGFTFRIVEAVKHIKINPMPRMAGLPWGLSLAAGIIITVLSLNPHMSIPSDMAIPTGSPLPVETRVLKTGEIPVDILKTSEISVISSKQGDGDSGEPQKLQNAFMLAPQQNKGGTWVQKADMPTARYMLGTCVVDGKLYAMGGTDGNQAFATIEVYDPATDTWTRKADMPAGRGLDGAVCAMNGKIYVIGGWPNPKAGTVLNEVKEYDPKTEKWTKKSDMPTKRAHLALCVVKGKIYAIGGYITNDVFTSAVEEYDPETDTWTKKADMPTDRAVFAAAAVNGKIYAIGGNTGKWLVGPFLSTVEEYDPVTDIWTKKADMPIERTELAASALNGKIYVVGGGSPKFLPTVLEYDPTTDAWREVANMPTLRACLSSAVVDGKLYAIGGYGPGQTLLPTVEEYDPEGWQAVSPQGKLPTKWGEVKSE
ncbi:sigma-70 family RNA polymerase sigma factor [Candidatus Poribacteria bacterium]